MRDIISKLLELAKKDDDSLENKSPNKENKPKEKKKSKWEEDTRGLDQKNNDGALGEAFAKQGSGSTAKPKNWVEKQKKADDKLLRKAKEKKEEEKGTVTESDEFDSDEADGVAHENLSIYSILDDYYGGKAWFKGGSYAYLLDSSKPNQMVASDGSVVKVQSFAQGIKGYADRYVSEDFFKCLEEYIMDKELASEFFRPVKDSIPMAKDGAPMYGGEQERHELAMMQGESKKSNILSGIMLAEYSTAAQRAEAEKGYKEFIAKGGVPTPAPNKKYKEPAPGTTLGSAHIGGRSEMAGGKRKIGTKANRVSDKAVANESQLNEYKPKIIPKTLAGGKLNPNHPGNAQAIAAEKEAKRERKDRATRERIAKAARAKTRVRKEKAVSKGQKIRAKLGSDTPNTPLEKKAQEAMWRVWNAIAPDAIEAMSHGGYEDEEDLFNDPFYVAEICCDANHMQSFADLSPEEEREILDNLDRNTLARLASNFGV